MEPKAFQTDVMLVGVTQTVGTLSRNCEGFAAAQCSNGLKPEQFRKIEPDLFGNIALVRVIAREAPTCGSRFRNAPSEWMPHDTRLGLQERLC